MQTHSILLCTLNSRFIHSAFGLRYIYANLEELQSQTQILEFTISQDTRRIAEKILAHDPKIVGFGVYIWNTRQTEEVISILKRVKPELVVVIGGPEVSHEAHGQSIVAKADYVIQGEADFLFRKLCRDLGAGIKPEKIIRADLPEISLIKLPYEFYTDDDVKNRVMYVEASRGCPYKCEYCLSSLDKTVRNFDLDLFLNEISKLIDRGARQFKFVDRTFNLSISFSTRILEFFLKRIDLGLFLHFELVPDRLPDELKELIVKFPPGSLQFEIGIQTFDPEVSKLISRKNNMIKVAENFKFLREKTGVHTHADLIVGLPGETLETFGLGFNQLVELDPDEVQVGILKRLKGTPIMRHDQEHQMIYQDHPPFQILSTKAMPFSTIQRMTLFAKFWDLVANSGNFKSTVKFLKSDTKEKGNSFFELFLELTDFLESKHPESHSIALLNLLESLWVYLTAELKLPEAQARELLLSDYCGSIKRDVPKFLRTGEEQIANPVKAKKTNLPPRQQRHLS